MAPCFIFPKPLLLAASVTVVLLVAGYSGGGARAGGAPYCGPTWSADQTEFPHYVDSILIDVVLVMLNQKADATTGETTYEETVPLGGGSGAATGNATCYSGTTDQACGDCIYEATSYLSQCRTYTTGGAYYDNKCFVQFWQV